MKNNGIFLIGQITIIPNILKRKWAIAIVTASGRPIARAAKKAVTVVPTLAPNVYGKICRKVRIPAPASGITSEVVIDEDCTSAVSISPKSMALMAVLKI